ncbi:hypothetical protein ABPG74_006707 [Tetrahymena malaccensis]
MSRLVLYKYFVGSKQKISLDFQNSENFNQNIFYIDDLLVIVWNTIYLLLFLSLNIERQFCHKEIYSGQNESLQHVNEQLCRLDFRFVRSIDLILNGGKKFYKAFTKNKDKKCQSEQCKEYYKMHKIINTIEQKKYIKVTIPDNYYIKCFYHIHELLTNQVEINLNILLKIRDEQLLLCALIERIMKGYVFNNTNKLMNQKLGNKKQIVQNIQSQILSLKALEKTFKQFSLNSLPQVAYDLNEAQ